MHRGWCSDCVFVSSEMCAVSVKSQVSVHLARPMGLTGTCRPNTLYPSSTMRHARRDLELSALSLPHLGFTVAQSCVLPRLHRAYRAVDSLKRPRCGWRDSASGGPPRKVALQMVPGGTPEKSRSAESLTPAGQLDGLQRDLWPCLVSCASGGACQFNRCVSYPQLE